MVRMSAEAAEQTGTAASAVHAEATPLAPFELTRGGAIDFAHLARMTDRDQNLEREVLELFALQADILLMHMREQQPAAIGALAHTLNGSARGIGAWRVAEAAEAVERSASEETDVAPALARLAAAVSDAQAAIRERLHARA
jgi:HPt (histidine-containing phosphotransfer) domain-containing protein